MSTLFAVTDRRQREIIPNRIDTYGAIVLGLPGGAPLAYWRFGETSGTTLADQMSGNRDIQIITGTVSYNRTGLPTASDGAIDFAGTGYAVIPHDAGLVLSAFTLSFWFKMNAFPLAGNRFMLVAKDLTGNNAGDTALVVEDNGQLTIQMNAGAGSLQVPTLPTLVIGQTYHVVLRANNTGFDAYLNGQYLGKSTSYTGAWTANTQQFEIAKAVAYPLTTNPTNFIIDEMALFGRVLTETEVLALGQRTSSPVAVNDSAVVDEQETTVIDVVSGSGGDTFAGQKADLTVIIVDDSEVTAGGHSVSVNASNDIEFVAGAVSGDQNVSFTYTITDTNGTSNVATVAVVVNDEATPPISNANLYPATGLSTVNVGTTAAIQTEVNNAPPGRHILVAPGTYAGIAITAQGTEANPIVIRPANGVLGSVTVTGVWTLANTSARVVIVGVNFNGGRVAISGNHNRVDLCTFNNIAAQSGGVDFVFSRDGRVSRCVFGTTQGTGPRNAVRLEPDGFDNGTNVRNLLDYCYLHDFVQIGADGASELIASFRQDANYFLDSDDIDVFTIDHCLITGYNVDNENELVSVKSGGWTIKYSTMDGNAGYYNMRNGCFNKVISCWFEDSTKNGNAGLNLKAQSHVVGGCRFLRSNLEVAPGNFDSAIETPTEFADRTGLSPHPCARACQVVNNIFDNSALIIGPNDTYPGGNVYAINNNQFGNTFQNGGQLVLGPKQTNTTNTNPGLGPFDAAVKLTPADVGLEADDPYA